MDLQKKNKETSVCQVLKIPKFWPDNILMRVSHTILNQFGSENAQATKKSVVSTDFSATFINMVVLKHNIEVWANMGF